MTDNTFIADLHIHSKYSRATARNLDIENLYIWAQRKGISVVGTGDFTHPAWFSELESLLEPAEPGLYRLKKSVADVCDKSVPVSCRAPVRFMLSCEISNIYKKAGQTRKNHNLVFFPNFDDVRRFNTSLEKIGNIRSDGRPILGLDARDLLEMMLEVSEQGFLVPAHIWTPWFSMLGSKSGFDSLEECFDDLSPYIFAAETGLSSDPAMNWRVENLDNITLISNSDAHSPGKLGREANRFATQMDYFAMRSALESGDKNQFKGTFEFYPEEGKYHVDGHRKCEICFTPGETKAHSGKCPVCGKPLTLGVLHRVEELATRPENFQPERAFPFYRLIPLDDLLSEILRVGVQSKKVKQTYHGLLDQLGSEFEILYYLKRDIIETAKVPLLGEAIERMRDGRISFFPGYDGIFGKVQIFSDDERNQLIGQRRLFYDFNKKVKHKSKSEPKAIQPKTEVSTQFFKKAVFPDTVIKLNKEQQEAVDDDNGHLMIIAGPGTGKTRTLTHKIAGLIQKGVALERILAVTFTNKAAAEMKERLDIMIGDANSLPFVGTFHSLGYQILSDEAENITVIDEKNRKEMVLDAIKINRLSKKGSGIGVNDLMDWIVTAKQRLLDSDDLLQGVCPHEHLEAFTRCYKTYQCLLNINNLADFEDIIFKTIRLLETNGAIRNKYIGRYDHLFIDEYQDINAGQYRLLQLLSVENTNICIIGDPDQSIYGFRGSDDTCFNWFKRDYDHVKTIFLNRNYRSIQTILNVSAQVIQQNPCLNETGGRRRVYSTMRGDKTIELIEVGTETSEAVAIGKKIEEMVGGTGFLSMDSGAVDSVDSRDVMSFADFAVLFRTRNQGDLIGKVLEKASIPCQRIDRRVVMDHPGIQNILAAFRLINNSGTVMDIQTAGSILNPGLSVKTLDLLKDWAFRNELSPTKALVQARRLPIPDMGRPRQKQLYAYTEKLFKIKEKLAGLSMTDMVKWLADEGGLPDKYAMDTDFNCGYEKLLSIAAEYKRNPCGFLANVSLSGNTDIYDQRAEKVALLTMHAAKGLEFPVVFIAGCEDEWIPYCSVNRPADRQEERRLFYVGLTRAKNHLFLTRAKRRRINGKMKERQWSPFVKDIENKDKHISGQTWKKIEEPRQRQLSLFEK